MENVTRLSLALPGFPTLKNIQGLALFDEGQDRNDKWKATVTTNVSVAEGEYNVVFFKTRYEFTIWPWAGTTTVLRTATWYTRKGKLANRSAWWQSN